MDDRIHTSRTCDYQRYEEEIRDSGSLADFTALGSVVPVKRLVSLGATMLVAGSTHACSRAFAIDLDFAAGSADLEKAEIVKLMAWLNKWQAIFPRFERVMVDGIAIESAQNAKAFSRRRAEVKTRAVRQLLEGVPIHESSHLNPPFSAFKGRNYAGIDLVPFQGICPNVASRSSRQPIAGIKTFTRNTDAVQRGSMPIA